MTRNLLATSLFGVFLFVAPAALAQQGPGSGAPGGAPPGDQRDDRGGPGLGATPPGGPGQDPERQRDRMRVGPGGPGSLGQPNVGNMGPGPGRGPGGQGGPGGQDGSPDGMGPNYRRPMAPPPVEVMRNYLELVRTYTSMSRDPTTAGVAAVIAARDMLKPRGPQAAIDYFTKILPDVKNEAVQRAIRGQLAELYRDSGNADKALEQLQALMTSAPAGEANPNPASNNSPPPAGR